MDQSDKERYLLESKELAVEVFGRTLTISRAAGPASTSPQNRRRMAVGIATGTAADTLLHAFEGAGVEIR